MNCYTRGFERVLGFHYPHCFGQYFGLIEFHDDGLSFVPILGTLWPK